MAQLLIKTKLKQERQHMVSLHSISSPHLQEEGKVCHSDQEGGEISLKIKRNRPISQIAKLPAPIPVVVNRRESKVEYKRKETGSLNPITDIDAYV